MTRFQESASAIEFDRKSPPPGYSRENFRYSPEEKKHGQYALTHGEDMNGTDRKKKIKLLLRKAEGYLELQMASHALEVLLEIDDPGDQAFVLYLLKGFALRDLQDHVRALDSLHAAEIINPNSVPLQMALAWCYKRTARLDRAISSTELAHRLDPEEPILLYNLACYLSLAGEKEQALGRLGQALRAAPSIARMIPKETDFDPLRNDPDFVKLVTMALQPKN